MTYSSMSGKRRIWFNGKLIHDSKQRFQKSSVPHRFRWEGGGYRLECLSLKSGENYKVNLIVDDIPFIKLPRRTAQISLKDVLKPRRMCRADGTWGESTAITLGCASEHLGKRLSGSKRRITYQFAFLEQPSEVHDLEIMYSILSGKREIKVDGKLIHKSQKLQMSLKFNHAFKAIGHMFEMLIEEKTDVILTRLCIDGIDFRRLPLLRPDQLRIAIKDQEKESMNNAAPISDDEEDEQEGSDSNDDDDDDDSDDDDEEEEDDDDDGVKDDAPKDLLADLFGDDGGSSNSASFDPFAKTTGVKNTNFADSPSVDKVQEIMDPFAQLMKKHRSETSNTPPAAPFDPFSSEKESNNTTRTTTTTTDSTFDPFAGL